MIAVKLKDTSVRGIISLVYYDTTESVLVGEAEVDLITNLKTLIFYQLHCTFCCIILTCLNKFDTCSLLA